MDERRRMDVWPKHDLSDIAAEPNVCANLFPSFLSSMTDVNFISTLYLSCVVLFLQSGSELHVFKNRLA